MLIILVRIRQSLSHTGTGFTVPWQPRDWGGNMNSEQWLLAGSDAHLYKICIPLVTPLLSACHHGTVGRMEVIFRILQETAVLGDPTEWLLGFYRGPAGGDLSAALKERSRSRRRRGGWTLHTNTKIGSSCLRPSCQS